MNQTVIGGIQQVGIGVVNLKEAWDWYRHNFGVDIRVFEEKAKASLMKDYTGGQVRSRHAAMAINLQGGGGFEIWQYTDRVPEAATFEVQMGDLGIFAIKIKSQDIESTFSTFKSKNLHIIGNIENDPRGEKYFFVKDPYGNLFQVVTGDSWFRNEKKLTGATFGAIIGTSNMERSIRFYSRILGYDKVIYDETGVFEDFSHVPGGSENMRRVLLFHSKERQGSFSRIFGDSYIELVTATHRKPNRIFKDRLWGDLGFIHLCFDIRGMQNLKNLCDSEGHPFTVDSFQDHDNAGFDMGEAAGHFAYIEDPDGTLIEFVETLKLPMIKKLGWYINLKKKRKVKALPNWMLKAMRFNRVKG